MTKYIVINGIQMIGEFAFKQCCWLVNNAKWGNKTLQAAKKFKPVLDAAEKGEDVTEPLAKFIKFYNKVKPLLP